MLNHWGEGSSAHTCDSSFWRQSMPLILLSNSLRACVRTKWKSCQQVVQTFDRQAYPFLWMPYVLVSSHSLAQHNPTHAAGISEIQGNEIFIREERHGQRRCLARIARIVGLRTLMVMYARESFLVLTAASTSQRTTRASSSLSCQRL
jgi:hypothetical protein